MSVLADPARGVSPPEPQDVSICNWCGVFLVFANDLHLRLPTPDEQAELAASAQVQAAKRAWEATRRGR